MSVIVQKFGGTSVADALKVTAVARRVIEAYDNGSDVVVVLSAQGDTTDILIDKAMEVNPSPSKREMDVLLSSGEQVSIALLAMAIEKLGRPVVSLTAWQIGLRTDSNYSNARIRRIVGDRIHAELGKRNIVVVAGFQGVNRSDDITTLGRGGSDTSAVALAATLGADMCQIFTDVTGVFTADPRIVPDARKLDSISYDEMLELASLGANVLHNRSVELAKKFNVKLEVLSSSEKLPGTIVKEETGVEEMLIRGVARDNDVARISLVDVADKPGKAFQVFSLLAKKKINVDIILQSIGRDNKKDISFTVSKSHLKPALDAINEKNAIIGASGVVHDENVSKVSIVGAGMTSNPGVASLMFEALFDANVNIQMISTSEIKISVLIDKANAEKAVRAIHSKFHLGN